MTCGPPRSTGSGKSAAFLLPLLHLLSAHPGRTPRQVRALVLVPTRELAMQLAGALDRYGRYLPKPLKSCVAVGGVSANPQMMALRGGADLVVATPGRALDLVEQNALQLSSVETLVLDEADRLLSLGFADELTRLLALLPARRQNLLFSATFPPAVQALAARLLHEPAAHQRGGLRAARRSAGAPGHHRAACDRGGHGQAHAAAAPPARDCTGGPTCSSSLRAGTGQTTSR